MPRTHAPSQEELQYYRRPVGKRIIKLLQEKELLKSVDIDNQMQKRSPDALGSYISALSALQQNEMAPEVQAAFDRHRDAREIAEAHAAHHCEPYTAVEFVELCTRCVSSLEYLEGLLEHTSSGRQIQRRGFDKSDDLNALWDIAHRLPLLRPVPDRPTQQDRTVDATKVEIERLKNWALAAVPVAAPTLTPSTGTIPNQTQNSSSCSARPPGANPLRDVDQIVLVRLINFCDATAAALHRINMISQVHQVHQDLEAVLTHLFEEQKPLNVVRDTLYGDTPVHGKNMVVLEDRLIALRRDAVTALSYASLENHITGVNRALGFLRDVFVLDNWGMPALPGGDGYAPAIFFSNLSDQGLAGKMSGGQFRDGSPEDIAKREAENRAYCERQFRQQRELVHEYHCDIRQQLLDIFSSANLYVPQGIVERSHWFTWNIGSNPITKEELLNWLTCESVADSSSTQAETSEVFSSTSKKSQVEEENLNSDRLARDARQPSKDRQADILAAIRNAGTPLTRPEIISAMKLSTEGKLGAHLAWMVDKKILVNISQQGYWPEGEPQPD